MRLPEQIPERRRTHNCSTTDACAHHSEIPSIEGKTPGLTEDNNTVVRPLMCMQGHLQDSSAGDCYFYILNIQFEDIVRAIWSLSITLPTGKVPFKLHEDSECIYGGIPYFWLSKVLGIWYHESTFKGWVNTSLWVKKTGLGRPVDPELCITRATSFISNSRSKSLVNGASFSERVTP